MINFQTIKAAKHICIRTQSDSFANASAVYTYILTLHKKVSLVSSEPVDVKFSFLPWFDKKRDIVPSSADVVLDISCKTKELYDFFITNQIKINKKMATSLYASLLKEHKCFGKRDTDGIDFALASELISLDAEYKLCHEYLNARVGLYEFRLKAVLFKNFILTDDAKAVEVFISDDELKETGSKLSDVYPLLEEFFTLVHVKEVTLKKSDEENKILINLKEK
jgi:phosphoesterase RecJ-like protein